MHQILEIEDLRLEIISWFHVPVTWRPEINHNPHQSIRNDRGALANLATTSRALNAELMPLLWRSLTDFRCLLRLIPQYSEPYRDVRPALDIATRQVHQPVSR